MTEILVDVNVPYDVMYIPRRGRTKRIVRLWTKRTVSIANPSPTEAPSAFRVTSAKPSREPEIPYDIRSFDQAIWWPIRDRARGLMHSDDFLNGLASGTYETLQVLNPALLWFNGYQPTYEHHFSDRIGDRIVKNGEDDSYAEIQRGVARVMLCNELVYFAGGAPVFFGCWSDHSIGQSVLSLHAGSPARWPHPWLLGPSGQVKADALREGHVFDISQLDLEMELLESRGLTIDVVHKIEGACDISQEDTALHLCADAAVNRLFTTSCAIWVAYRELIPYPRLDRSELIPLDICRTILTEAVRHSWPEELGSRHLSVALADATNVLNRLEPNGELGLEPEDEEALASLSADPAGAAEGGRRLEQG
jgi:hypothetical protein